jgi:outer membrane protein assembly factor BamA
MKGNTINKTNGWLSDFKISVHSFSSIVVLLLLLFPFTYASGSDNVVKIVEVEGLTRIKEQELIELIGLNSGDTFNTLRLYQNLLRGASNLSILLKRYC